MIAGLGSSGKLERPDNCSDVVRSVWHFPTVVPEARMAEMILALADEG